MRFLDSSIFDDFNFNKMFSLLESYNTAFQKDLISCVSPINNKYSYSIVNKRENKETIVLYALGVNKEDIKIETKTENGMDIIKISGKTKEKITEKEYSINYCFAKKIGEIEKISSKLKNGLLYVDLELKQPKQSKIEINWK